jgi:hypothetical protein
VMLHVSSRLPRLAASPSSHDGLRGEGARHT